MLHTAAHSGGRQHRAHGISGHAATVSWWVVEGLVLWLISSDGGRIHGWPSVNELPSGHAVTSFMRLRREMTRGAVLGSSCVPSQERRRQADANHSLTIFGMHQPDSKKRVCL